MGNSNCVPCGERDGKLRKDGKKLTKAVLERKLENAGKSGVLNLASSGLSCVDPRVWTLHGLRSLDLSNNRIVQIAPEIASLSKLKTLTLSGNALQFLPDLSQCASLQTVDCSRNAIQGVGQLPPSLTRLTLAENPLRELPATLLTARSLKELDVSQCQLAVLPGAYELPALRVLVLDGNQLTELPAALAQLPSLHLLSVKDNRLRAVPRAILAESPVEALWLTGNRVTREQLRDMDGYEEYLAKHKRAGDKKLAGGLTLEADLCGL